MIKFKQHISESFNRPYKYKTSEVLPGQLYEMVFKTQSGDKVVVEIEAWDKRRMNWEIEFFRNEEQHVTGEGDAMRIFATVIKIIEDFVKKHSPDSIKFSAHKEEEESLDKKGSREKLYSRMVKRFAGGMGYKVKEKGDKYGTYYTLTKKFGWEKK